MLKIEDESQKEPELDKQELLEYMVYLQTGGYVDAYIQKGLKGEPIGCVLKGITPLGRVYLKESQKEGFSVNAYQALRWVILLVIATAVEEIVRRCFLFIAP